MVNMIDTKIGIYTNNVTGSKTSFLITTRLIDNIKIAKFPLHLEYIIIIYYHEHCHFEKDLGGFLYDLQKSD